MIKLYLVLLKCVKISTLKKLNTLKDDRVSYTFNYGHSTITLY